MHPLIATWFGWVRDWHYLGVFLLMAMESSVLPVPSELVIPPAAYWASQGEMSMAGVVFAGTAGSYFGAMVMYVASRLLGRPLVLRYGRFVMVSPAKLERAERFLVRYETGGVFFARLLPVIRHLIGIPAGIVRMKPMPYSIMTVIGAEPQLMNDPDALVRALKHKSMTVIAAVVVLSVLYIAVVRMTSNRTEPS
jgi:membrane protein DedA with SNARE-associated domain